MNLVDRYEAVLRRHCDLDRIESEFRYICGRLAHELGEPPRLVLRNTENRVRVCEIIEAWMEERFPEHTFYVLIDVDFMESFDVTVRMRIDENYIVKVIMNGLG